MKTLILKGFLCGSVVKFLQDALTKFDNQIQ